MRGKIAIVFVFVGILVAVFAGLDAAAGFDAAIRTQSESGK